MAEADVFKALADPTRYAIFAKLAGGTMHGTALREGLGISQPAMSQHLAALRRAGLIQQERRGRFVHYGVDPQGLTIVAGWLARYRAHWPAQIKALQSLLKDMDR